jgi:hypothetical protein
MAGKLGKATSILGIGEVKVPRFKVAADGTTTADGDNIYYFQTSKIYKNPAVATACGITFINIEDWEGAEPLVKVEQLILTNKLNRYYAQCYSTNTAGEEVRKVVSIFCTPAKTATIIGTKGKLQDLELKRVVKGVEVSLGKVFDVRQKTRDTFS